MSVSILSRLLPYALLTFVGIAGWSMNSQSLLAVVVLGTVGVAIGTGLQTRNNAKAREPQTPQKQY